MTVDNKIKRFKAQIENGLKNFDRDAKAAIPGVVDCCKYEKGDGGNGGHEGGGGYDQGGGGYDKRGGGYDKGGGYERGYESPPPQAR